MTGATTAVAVEEARTATVPVSGYLFLIFQNGLHALESQVVCNVKPLPALPVLCLKRNIGLICSTSYPCVL